MKILLCSHWFHPSVGGVEMVSKLLTIAFVKAGAEVTVVTQTAGGNDGSPLPEFGGRILRSPTIRQLLDAGRDADVLFQNHISLQTFVPLMILRKPTVVAHHSWLRTTEGKRNWQNYLKLLAIRTADNCAISTSIAQDLPVPAITIPDPFDVEEFLPFHGLAKTKDIVFVGRLVSDKGCDLLLQALGRLRSRTGMIPETTIIGSGPDKPLLEALATKLGLNGFVTFLGSVQEGRGRLIAQHKIQVVPSLWNEPFGIVGVEGVASGCAMIVSAGGGLPEAVGPCGLLFPNGDVEALTSQLERLLRDEELRVRLTSQGPAYVERFRPENVAAAYLRVFEAALAGKR